MAEHAQLHGPDSISFLMFLLQKDKGSGVVVKAIFGRMSPKLLASINAMYVYACTGQGKAAMKEQATARTCIRLAVRDKDYLFTAADSAKFGTMITMSEVRSRRSSAVVFNVAQTSGQQLHRPPACMDQKAA